ncbi:MAG: hypothetical protein H6719_03455 [Sandaracinaceae bacterium]|nr:hypothetical protein [Sandaracinaceae bacterium]
MRGSCLFAILTLGCGSGPIVIDARGDAGGGVDAGTEDGGAMDAATPDGGALDGGPPGTDGGCTASPPLPAWEPVDTGGPAGEDVAACLARVGGMTDDRLPVAQRYDLTTFGGPGDAQPVACPGAADADGTWYYAANRQRFSCGQRVRLVDEARTSCVIVEVADVGPNACVEEAGGLPIWDVSPLAAQELFGVSSAGWSEHRGVFGAPVGSANALGPCALGAPRDYLRGFVGGPCDAPGDCTYADAVCLTEFAGGACSLPCDTSCPDREGANAYTACVDMGATGRRCLARCDFTLFATGCRDGQVCERRPHPTGATADRWVCVPDPC